MSLSPDPGLRLNSRARKLIFLTVLCSFLTLLAGCSTTASSGPSRRAVTKGSHSLADSQVRVIDVNAAVAAHVLASMRSRLFSEAFPENAKSFGIVRAGDVVEVSVWEVPPAALFASSAMDPRLGPSTSNVTVFPEQVVSSNGYIKIPFAGMVPVAGRTTSQIENEITKRLTGKANGPQVLVRLMRNNSSNVTIVGEVNTSTRMPLTPSKERLLDALAAAGGTRHPVDKITLQLTRGATVQALPLDTVIRDPKQNIVLQPGDVLTSLYQPLSFTVLGATGKNEEINFEAKGISLAQALGRFGGLQDNRADARGVFIFRMEETAAVAGADAQSAVTPDGKVPVIYRVDLKDPTSFFVAQSFPIKNGDVVFVSNSPSSELQKFLNMILSIAYPINSILNTTR